MISKLLLEKIYDSAYVQRWNDKYRPVEFTELDKQAHKMSIAYLLGLFEENRPGFDWIEIIETGLFVGLADIAYIGTLFAVEAIERKNSRH